MPEYVVCAHSIYSGYPYMVAIEADDANQAAASLHYSLMDEVEIDGIVLGSVGHA